MGIDRSFRYPTYEGHGGLPLNLEFMIRKLEREYGERIDWWEVPLAGLTARHEMSKIEDWWERGPGKEPPNVDGILHNLAVYGWDLRDALSWTADALAKSIKAPKDDVLNQVVEDANLRAALRVYASARDNNTKKALTVFEAAEELGRQGTVLADGTVDPAGEGIGALGVLLGANNALGTVLALEARWSGDGYDHLPTKWKSSSRSGGPPSRASSRVVRR
jgi:hypothetical protein